MLGMPVLVALNAADTALAIEALTDEQAVAEAMQVSLLAARIEVTVTSGCDSLSLLGTAQESCHEAQNCSLQLLQHLARVWQATCTGRPLRPGLSR